MTDRERSGGIGSTGRIAAALWGALALAAGCGDGTGDGRTGPDSDGDTILDVDEGAELSRDTDGDGWPDFMDFDSDDDGIPDVIEAGDVDPASAPIDSDDDGLPDYVDLDSDDNGYLDWQELSADGVPIDFFGDGVPDYRELDDDHDLVLDRDELAGLLDPPLDSDGDGVPNYRDPDSDDDGILDGHDGMQDSDGDGLRNVDDLDSDFDGFPDAVEAGDDDLRTLPVDTDGDGQMDFVDLDSDDDGLSDARERELGTSPTLVDSDGDGVSDMVEVAGCFDPSTGCTEFPSDPTRSPRTEGNFVFVLPYEGEPDPPADTLRFQTDIRYADVYLLMDTTCSMVDAVESLQAEISREPDGLIARVRDTIPDPWFGVGEYRDYPVGGYGSVGVDFAYHHVADISPSALDAQRAVDSLYAGFRPGSSVTCFNGCHDRPEAQVPALYATVTGDGLPGKAGVVPGPDQDPNDDPMPPRRGCDRSTWGYPCFRDRAVPIVVMIADAPMHNDQEGGDPYDNAVIGGPAPEFADALGAVRENNVSLVGLLVLDAGRFDDPEPTRRDLSALLERSGSLTLDGQPFMTEWDTGDPISDAVVEQIEAVAANTRFDITLAYQDGPEDRVDTYAEFVESIEALPGGALVDCPVRTPFDTDDDGLADTFFNVGTGSGVCFRVAVKPNTTIPGTAEPQLFRAELTVVGNGFTDLDTRTLYFLVPPDPRLVNLR